MLNILIKRLIRCCDAQGSVLVVALLVMLAVTILGVASLNTSTTEVAISGNERRIRASFYLAESAAMEGVQRLKETPLPGLNDKSHFWHHARSALEKQGLDFRKPDHWDVDGKKPDNGLKSPMDSRTFISAVEWDVATGASLVVTGPRLYVNRVYGFSQKDHIDDLVEIGYAIRY